jgi:hypothetical protein
VKRPILYVSSSMGEDFDMYFHAPKDMSDAVAEAALALIITKTVANDEIEDGMNFIAEAAEAVGFEGVTFNKVGGPGKEW